MATELISKCAKAGGSLTKDELRSCNRVAEIMKEVCRQSTARLVAASQGAPVMQSCAADGTPIQVSVQCQQSLPSGRAVKIAGKCAHEFLIANSFVRMHTETGDAKTVATIRDPIPLTSGKGTLQISAASRSTWCTLRQLGHRGGVVQHYCWDRCGFTALRRRTLQFHTLLREQWSLEEGLDSTVLWLLEWIICTPCAVHDSHNAFKWAMKEQFDNPDLLRTVFIGSCSVRNSMDVIMAYLAEWAAASVQESPPLDEVARQDLRVLWTTLGVDDEVVHVLTNTLELRLDGAKVLVRQGGNFQDTLNIVVCALMAVWRVTKFTESRWLSIGKSSRALVASRLTGLKLLLEYASKKPSVSAYYTGGFFRMQAEEWLFLVQTAVVARVPETVQEGLLRDSRVALHAPKLKADMAKAMDHLASLPSWLWSTLATLGGIDGQQLKAQCIRSAHRACAFMQFRVFESAESLPWSLCRGDVVSNLRALKEGPRPAKCDISAKAWDLLDMGWSVQSLRRMVDLLAESPWATTTTEQLHGSAAVIARFHPEYTLCTLLARSLALATAKLLPRLTKEEKVVHKCKARLSRVDRKCPEKAGARQAFFGDLCKVAADKYLHRGVSLQKIRKSLMKSHSEAFKKKSATIKGRYRKRARAEAAAKRLAHLEQRRIVSEGLSLARERVEKDARRRGPLLLSTSAWGEWELHLFETLLDDDCYSGPNLLKLRDKACTAPAPWSQTLVEALDEQEIPADAVPPELPEWLKRVALHRNIFEAVAFSWREQGTEVVYKFMFAMQNPWVVYLCPLHPVDTYLDLSSAGPSWSSWPRKDFEVDFLRCTSSVCMHHLKVEDVSVIHGVRHLGGRFVQSSATTVPLASALDLLPAPRSGTSREASSSSHKAPPLEPWAEKLLEKRNRRQPAPPTLEKEEAEDDAELADLAEELHNDPAVLELLAQFREEWATTEDQRCHDFQVTLLGGSWTAANKGVVADAFSACARGEAVAWCKTRAIARSARYEISLYGEENASTLARVWCSRMQFLFNLSKKAGNALHVFTQNEKASWVEPSELARVEAELAGVTRAQARIRQIRSLC